MAHNYPEGEQARWNELERRVLQADVDIKRLWKWMPDPRTIILEFDGNLEEPAGSNVLIYSPFGSVATISTLFGGSALLGEVESALSGSGITATLMGNNSGTADISEFSLIYIMSTGGGSGSFPSWIDATEMTAWLTAQKQRRLVLCGEFASSPSGAWQTNITLNAYLAAIGCSIGIVDAIISFPDSDPEATASSHYLASGITGGLAFNGCSSITGGTLLWSYSGSSPGDIGAVESTGSGSEIIVMGDSSWATVGSRPGGHAAYNQTWIRRLYPSASYGGMLIP